jgi:hypothetical protein
MDLSGPGIDVKLKEKKRRTSYIFVCFITFKLGKSYAMNYV